MAGKGYSHRTFVQPMDWASDEVLQIMRRELEQEVAAIALRRECARLARETTGLLAVERELQLRGMA